MSIDTIKNKVDSRQLLREAYNVAQSHRIIDVVTMAQQGGKESTISDIAVVIKEGQSYYLIKGIAVCNIYYLFDFPQTSILQANVSIINTQSKIGEHIYQKICEGSDSIAVHPQLLNNDPRYDFQAKIFLLSAKSDGSFRFYRKPFLTFDAAFYEVEEFDYLPGFGILSFASKLPHYTPLGGIGESNEYFRFVPVSKHP